MRSLRYVHCTRETLEGAKRVSLAVKVRATGGHSSVARWSTTREEGQLNPAANDPPQDIASVWTLWITVEDER